MEVPPFPRGDNSGIVWVFCWPSLLGGRTGPGPAPSPACSLHWAVKPGEGIVPTPPAGAQELWLRCSTGGQFLASLLFYLNLLVSPGQVSKLRSTLGPSDMMVTREAPRGKQHFVSQIRRWDEILLVTGPSAWTRGNDSSRKKRILRIPTGVVVLMLVFT